MPSGVFIWSQRHESVGWIGTHVTEHATMSVEEAAEYTGFGITNLRELVNVDRIPHLHIGAKGARVRIPVKALGDWLYQTATKHVRPDERVIA